MSTPSTDVGNAFSRSWQLLTSNWIIIVPGLIIGIIAGLVGGLLAGQAVTTDATGAPVITGSAFAPFAAIVSMVAMVLTIAYTTGMAGAAWATGTATLADGSAAFKREGAQIFLALLVLFVVSIVAAILMIFTLGLSMLAYLVFFLYTMPAVVVGDRPAFTAIQESCQLAVKRFGPTIITVLLIAVITVCASVLAGALSFAPFIGPILAQVIQQIVVAYFTLVIVGEYLAFRGDLVPVAPSAPPPAAGT